MLTLGADGVLLGTRLLFTPESGYTPVQKEILLEADLDATRRGMCFDEVTHMMGWPPGIDGRAIANGIWRDYEAGLDLDERIRLFDAGRAAGEKERTLVWAGVGAGLTNEIKGASEVVKEIHEDAVKALRTAAAMLIVQG